MSNSPWHGRGLHTEKGVSDLVHGATYTRVVCHLCNKDTLEADTQKDTLVSARWMNSENFLLISGIGLTVELDRGAGDLTVALQNGTQRLRAQCIDKTRGAPCTYHRHASRLCLAQLLLSSYPIRTTPSQAIHSLSESLGHCLSDPGTDRPFTLPQ
jgi:hypothetical protein